METTLWESSFPINHSMEMNASRLPSTSDKEHKEIDTTLFYAGNRAEDIAMVHNQGFVIDNDNELAPENVGVQPDANNLYPRQTLEVQT
ncbi:hypothetical protein ACHAWX_001036 [Stephanocyclus meneghinianus]